MAAAGNVDTIREEGSGFGVAIFPSSSPSDLGPPSSCPSDPVAMLPFRDAENVEIEEKKEESECDDADGVETENGAVLIHPIACARLTVFRAFSISSMTFDEPVRFLVCLSVACIRFDVPVDNDDIDSELCSIPSPPSPFSCLIDARLDREKPCSGCVSDILFPADRDGGSVADSGMAELWRCGRVVMIAVVRQDGGLGFRGVGCVSTPIGVMIQSEDMLKVYVISMGIRALWVADCQLDCPTWLFSGILTGFTCDDKLRNPKMSRC